MKRSFNQPFVIPFHCIVALVCCAILSDVPDGFLGTAAFGQVTGDGTNEDSNADDSNTDDANSDNSNTTDSGNNAAFVNGNTAGISIDAGGVVRRLMQRGNLALRQQRLAAAFARRNQDVFKPSQLRKVSLNRLERAATEVLAGGGQLPDEMIYLAGLSRVHSVFLYPEHGEVVLAGPAAEWSEMGDGNVLSIVSQQPVIRLEDLIVALRTFCPGEDEDAVISCSIDPTQEGLARMQAFLNSVGSRAPSAETIVRGLKKTLGLHDVTIGGVPPTTRLAQVMVAADYRMKLIGIGLETPPVKIPSYVSIARPASRGRGMARWYFTPNYECVRVDDEELALQLVGSGVQLISQAEFVAANGTRHESARRDGASERFVRGFTAKYPQLAARCPIYAELRNIVDLSLVAAFLQQSDAYGQCHWTPDLFADEDRLAVQVHPVPKRVYTAATAVWKGSHLMTPVGGGVNIRPSLAFEEENLLQDADGSLYALKAAVSFADLEDDQWWWD